MGTTSTNRYNIGDLVPLEDFTTLEGLPVSRPAEGRSVHIQFRRFAGCPICNLHLREFVRRRDELEGAGIHEVIVFHSTVEELRHYEADLPLDVVADPHRRLYVRFGVEAGPRAYGLRFLPKIPAVAANLIPQIIKRRRLPPPITPEGGLFGLPADVLVGHDGRVTAIKYGEHAYDQWSVDEVEALADTDSV